jgi:squalene-hopene/tetraprenyl-beta-curcumene cyclase
MRLPTFVRVVAMMAWSLPLVGGLSAAEPLGPQAADLARARQQGIAFLKASQREDGSWTASEAPGVTGLVTFGLLSAGVPANDPVITKALAHLQGYRQPDGGVYNPKTHHGNYETAIAMMVFHAAKDAGQFEELLKQGDQYVRGVQWDESEKLDRSDVKYGGAGYGRTGDRPDLSNTVFFLEALQAAGATKDDPAVQKALVFLSRCQNLETEFNTTEFAVKVNDGGFYYTPAAGGNSQAGNTPEGGLRSYGSMTYAGLKSMIYAGLTPDDPRVKAATEWIRKFYSVSENPGLGQQGVYYYHQMFAKALSTMDADTFTDAEGRTHDWRKELAEHLIGRQQSNGSWVNENARWMEGDPNLATAYVLMALKYCDPIPAP